MRASLLPIALSSARARTYGRTIVRAAVALCFGAWGLAAYATAGSAGFGVSATVVHRVVAQTPVGSISTLCDQSACPAPSINVDPVDAQTGTRIVRVIY